jgi:hypothetical protein
LKTLVPTGTNTSPDPDEVTPSGGYDAYLNIALHAHDVGTTTTTGYPSSYGNTQQITAGDSMGCGIGGAHLVQVASSEDPGNFTISQTRDWIAATISIRSAENEDEDSFFNGEIGFGEFALQGSLLQDSDTFNGGKTYFGVRLSAAQADKSGSTITADAFTIASARPWISCMIAIRGS